VYNESFAGATSQDGRVQPWMPQQHTLPQAVQMQMHNPYIPTPFHPFMSYPQHYPLPTSPLPMSPTSPSVVPIDQLCTNYKLGLPCPYRDVCPYKHFIVETEVPFQSIPSSSIPALASPSQNYRAVCAFYQAGNCRNGDSCKFRHELALATEPQLVDYRKKKPCIFFSAGHCNKGSNCPFLHENTQTMSMEKSTADEIPSQREAHSTSLDISDPTGTWGQSSFSSNDVGEKQDDPWTSPKSTWDCVTTSKGGNTWDDGWARQSKQEAPTSLQGGTWQDKASRRNGKGTCHWFGKTGSCRYGDRCKWLHDREGDHHNDTKSSGCDSWNIPGDSAQNGSTENDNRDILDWKAPSFPFSPSDPANSEDAQHGKSEDSAWNGAISSWDTSNPEDARGAEAFDWETSKEGQSNPSGSGWTCNPGNQNSSSNASSQSNTLTDDSKLYRDNEGGESVDGRPSLLGDKDSDSDDFDPWITDEEVDEDEDSRVHSTFITRAADPQDSSDGSLTGLPSTMWTDEGPRRSNQPKYEEFAQSREKWRVVESWEQDVSETRRTEPSLSDEVYCRL
jgi:hypothetical protein